MRKIFKSVLISSVAVGVGLLTSAPSVHAAGFGIGRGGNGGGGSNGGGGGFKAVSCSATKSTSYNGNTFVGCEGSITSGNLNPTQALHLLNGTPDANGNLVTATTVDGGTLTGPLFGGITDWKFDSKIDTDSSGGTVAGTSSLGFDINPETGTTSGDWGFTNSDVFNIVLELKAANDGLSYYFFQGISGNAQLLGEWDTLGLTTRTQNGTPIGPDLSHASLFYSQGPVVGPPISAVPEPSSIVGTTLFLGAISYLFYRKKRKNTLGTAS